MGRAYLVLVDEERRTDDPARADRTAALRTLGLQSQAAFGAVEVFASDDTPVLRLPDGGVLIGDLHSRSGTAVRDPGRLPASGDAVRQHVLEHCWGDYVLVSPDAHGPRALSVTRSPSPACDLPCVYALHGDRGFVTSDATLAARLGLYRKRVDFDYVVHRLHYPGLKTGRTGLAGIRELLPGGTLRLRDGGLDVRQDWHPWDFTGAAARYADRQEAASTIRDAIARVIGAWADRDASILLELSGGLDSSIVGICLRDSRARVACSTLTTPVPGADEREYARLIADLLRVELAVEALGYDDAPFAFPLPQQLASPAIGPLQYAVDRRMEAAAERSGANAYYCGAGGDTVFCYLTSAAPAADAFRAAGLADGIRTVGDLALFHQCTYWKAARLTLRRLVRPAAPPPAADRSLLSRHVPVPEPEPHPWLSAPPDALAGDRQRIHDLSGMPFFRDSCPRGLARRVRMPLLSQPVVEACLRAPSWMWFSGGRNRALARDAFSDALPPGILMRKSKGTFTAYLGALYRRRRSEIRAFLLDGELHARRLLDPRALLRLAEAEPAAGAHGFLRVFELCTLENWCRQHTAR